ncbi:MAG: rubrerythrin [Proteobacteria bacterium]|nr:rubrerythrin [Pseudomonadota bacterium]
MSIDFNANEIFDMAMQIERNGAIFYRLAAKHSGDPNTRHMLLELATREDAHEKVFASMRENLSASEKLPTIFDPHGEAASYLRALADGHVFDLTKDPTDFLTPDQSVEVVLRKAIEIEKDSIIFYLGMKDVVPHRLGKNRIDHIIREEKRHIVSLSDKLAGLHG